MTFRLQRLLPGLAILLLPQPARAQLVAEQITEATAAARLIGGTQAVGGVGDWYLANDIVEIIVDDPARRQGEVPHGGTLVDAGLRDRTGEDQLGQVMPIFNLDQRVQAHFDTIRAEVDPAQGWARLVVSASQGMVTVRRPGGFDPQQALFVPEADAVRGVQVETEFKVLPGEPFVHLTTTFRNTGTQPAPLFAYSDAILHGLGSMRAWFGNTVAPARTRGFAHHSFSVASLVRSTDALAPLTYVSFPGMRHYPPIAYALCEPERVANGGVLFGVTDGHVGAITTFLFDHDWQEISMPRMLRARGRTLAPGASWTYHRLFLVAGRHDVAATTDVLFPLLAYADGSSGVQGRVTPPAVPHVIHVRTAPAGTPVTQLATTVAGPDAGVFRASLPPGNYTLEVRAPQRPPQFREVRVTRGAFADVGEVRLTEPGWLVFEPAFIDAGPGRVVVRGEGETPDPVFNPEMLDFRLDGERVDGGMETRDLYFVGTAADRTRVAVPPGTYRLLATRGLEHGVASRVVRVDRPGQEVTVAPFNPPRAIELPGYITADFHVHGEASDDTSLTNMLRLSSFVAEGVDVLTSTEHDNVNTFEAALDALGVRDHIRVLIGTEITGVAPNARAPWTIGHSNAWPIAYDPHASRHGAPPHEGMSLADAYEILRRDYDPAVIQLNHPRPWTPDRIGAGSYFSHLGDAGEGFDPALPITAYPNNRLLQPAADGYMRALDFDAIEVLNWGSYPQFLQVRRDWYALLRQDIRRTGTANSDTHGPRSPAGYPRNYVYYPAGLDGWNEVAFHEAVLQGRTFGTSGPLIVRFTVNGGVMGDTVRAPGGAVTVGLTVAAASWVPVEEVRLLVNGEVLHTFADLPPVGDAPVIRFEQDVDLRLERDSFVTVEAGVPLQDDPTAPRSSPGGVYEVLTADRFQSMAFTNPIFVKVSGGRWFIPPGLPPQPEARTMAIPMYVFGGVLFAMGCALWWARRQA